MDTKNAKMATKIWAVTGNIGGSTVSSEKFNKIMYEIYMYRETVKNLRCLKFSTEIGMKNIWLNQGPDTQ